MSGRYTSGRFFLLAIALFVYACMLARPARAAATITIVNMDGAGEGFNDPTPVAPVGGNPGTTLGQQRLNAFQFAANVWGARLNSAVEIRIQSSFDPLTCTATSAVLGAASTIQIFANFSGAEFPLTWYHSALANKLAGVDLAAGPPGTRNDDILAMFNSNIGLPGCLTGINWYYGLDNNHGVDIDLVTVLLHEFAHGLGFSSFVNVANGSQPLNLPDVYSTYTLDTTAGKTWGQMTNAERAASAINSRKVVWSAAHVTEAAPAVLSPGTPLLQINSPAGIAGNYDVGPAEFGPPLSSPGITGDIVLADDATGTVTDACEPLTNGAAIAGNIALVDRGTCNFTVKVKNAQDAGAIAVLVADNVAGSPPSGLGGSDPTITIPSARITLADGNTIKANLPGVNVTLGVDLSVLAGADPSGRLLLNTPNPVQPGSSISHWDPIASPNQLMEPAINADLTHNVGLPNDLTLRQMVDVGWFSDADGVADGLDRCIQSDTSPTVVIQACDSGAPNPVFPTGCTISDVVGICAARTTTHTQFVNCVSAVAQALVTRGVLTTAQRDAIVSCADQSTLP